MPYRKLKVWQKADELALKVYQTTNNYPDHEIYGLTSQLRRAALSVPTNLVEGYAKKGDKELARFVNISLGSLAETEYLLSFSQRLGYLNRDEYQRIEKLRADTGKMLWAFYKKIKNT